MAVAAFLAGTAAAFLVALLAVAADLLRAARWGGGEGLREGELDGEGEGEGDGD